MPKISRSLEDIDAERYTAGGRGVHLTIADDSRLSYRVDPDGDLHFTMLGPMELEMLMSPTALKRCHELFTEAVAQVHGSTEVDS